MLDLLKLGVPYFLRGESDRPRYYALGQFLHGKPPQKTKVAIPRRADLIRAVGRGRVKRTLKVFPSWGEFVWERVWERVPEFAKYNPDYVGDLLGAIVKSSRKGYCNLSNFASHAHIGRKKAAEIMEWFTGAGIWIPILPFPHAVGATAQRTRCHGVFFDAGIVSELGSGDDHDGQIFRTAVISDLIANLGSEFQDFKFWYFQRNQTVVDLIFKASGTYHAVVVHPSNESVVRCPHFIWNLEREYGENLNWGDAYLIYHGTEIKPLSEHYNRGWAVPFDAYVSD